MSTLPTEINMMQIPALFRFIWRYQFQILFKKFNIFYSSLSFAIWSSATQVIAAVVNSYNFTHILCVYFKHE